MTTPRSHVVILLPCRNEAASIAQVVTDFRHALPEADILVIDNGSDDATATQARSAGAQIITEPRPGKGLALRRGFAAQDADIYIMADGDATYEAAAAPALLAKLQDEQLDMVVGVRDPATSQAYRPWHAWGNRLFGLAFHIAFGVKVSDLFSGYRVVSRRFIRSFPILAKGFEIETEMTAHAIELGVPIAELPTRYEARLPGTASKLRTLVDGWSILTRLVILMSQARPLLVYTSLAFLIATSGLALGLPIIADFLSTGLVPRFPTALLASSLMLLAGMLVHAGLVLQGQRLNRIQAKQLAYLSQSPIRK